MIRRRPFLGLGLVFGFGCDASHDDASGGAGATTNSGSSGPSASGPSANASTGNGNATHSVASSATGGATSDLVHGQLFTIVGAGFGTRPDFNRGNYTFAGHRHMHRLVADLEGGLPVDGASRAEYVQQLKGLFPAVNFSFTSASSAGIAILDGGPSRSGKFLRKESGSFASSGYLEHDTEDDADIPGDPTHYISFKHRGAGDGKIYRWWVDGEGSDGKNWYMGSSGMHRETIDGPAAYYFDYERDATTWRRHEIFAQVSPGLGMWIDGAALRFGDDGETTSQPMIVQGDSNRGILHSWPNSVDDGGTFDYADIVLDFTFARVDVSVGGKSEFCPVVSWTDDTIVAVYNQGEMSAGTATVRVYDAANAVLHTETRTAV